MTINLKYDAQAAIDASAERNEIVHILANDADYITLLINCDDSTDAGQDEQGRKIKEYWGESEAGSWRVHAHAPMTDDCSEEVAG